MNVSDWYCRKKHLEVPDSDQTSSNKDNSDILPGMAPASKLYSYCCLSPYAIIMMIYFGLIALHTVFSIDGAESNVQLMKSGQSVAARLLSVIEDLEQTHATFQRREKEDGTSVILNP